MTLIQRFGSALNLNVHLHLLILDGVYLPTSDGLRFRRVPAPSAGHLRKLLDRIIARLVRRLATEELPAPDPEQPWLNVQPQDTLDHLGGASTRDRIAIGPGAGSCTLTLKNPAL